MEYLTVLDAIIRRGTEAASRDYVKSPDKLAGAIAGFEACRDKSPHELKSILADARKATWDAHHGDDPHYWRVVCFEREVEWVCNCISVILAQNGVPTIVPPTARATILIAQLVGVGAPD